MRWAQRGQFVGEHRAFHDYHVFHESPVPHGRVELREFIDRRVMEDMVGVENHGVVEVTTSLKWLTGLLSGPRGMLVST
jgi:hypothetical protein